MKFSEFMDAYQTPGRVILLEGKRHVDPADMLKLTELGRLLATQLPQAVLRSGNAFGSDELFALGMAQADLSRMQVITPAAGRRKKSNQGHETISLNQIDLAADPDIVDESKHNAKNRNLIDLETRNQKPETNSPVGAKSHFRQLPMAFRVKHP